MASRCLCHLCPHPNTCWLAITTGRSQTADLVGPANQDGEIGDLIAFRRGFLFYTIEVLGELRSGRHGSSRRRALSSASRRWAAPTRQRCALLSSLGRRCVHPSADLFGELREPESGREKREKSSSWPSGSIGSLRRSSERDVTRPPWWVWPSQRRRGQRPGALRPVRFIRTTHELYHTFSVFTIQISPLRCF